ncbi:hypothetical protein [Actinoplanes palleronii]|uniref:DUF4367 domain-containing protein n=1 Tax=Actinoplanes palleronii TaxID=113570 RepID=A0ABQ4BRT8_9ACTN|nr:hypothetical protein [Actinoplanes palleronii]GIE73393.1 hypothetical protein Apa02nite_095010 [Actinoplanes palleronii]
MSRDIEDLIRSAQEHQADRAVPPDRIRSALPRRAVVVRRRQRYGLLGATVAAVAVAGAVTVPVLALRGGDPASSTTAPGAAGTAAPSTGATAAPVPAGTLPRDIALRYRPTWVPAGLIEGIRQHVAVEPGAARAEPWLVRVWKKQAVAGDPWDGPEMSLNVRTVAPGYGANRDTSGEAVDINGAEGEYVNAKGDTKAYVTWLADERTALSVSVNGLALSKADLLRTARSVRPDTGLSAVPVRLGWLPTGWTANSVAVSGTGAAAWRAQVSAFSLGSTGKPKEGAGGQLSVTVGSSTEAPSGGEQLTVGGHPARHPVRTDEPGQGLIYLVVDLGGGRVMTVVGQGAGLTLDDVRKVAERTEVSPAGQSWLDR